MKIRCKRCGKWFEYEMYNGLCPKCGSYNRAETADSLALQRFKEESEGEEAHRKLHREYDTLGSGYNRWHDGMKEEEYEAEYGDDGYSEDEENDLLEGAARGIPIKEPKSKPPVKTVIFLLLVTVLVPVICLISYQLWERSCRKDRLLSGREIPSFAEASGNAVTLTDTEMEYPVTVRVQGSCMRSHEALEQNKMFYYVKATIDCDGYNFKHTPREVFLRYRRENQDVYRIPTRVSFNQEHAGLFGIAEEELLSSYSVSLAGETEGYWVFIVDADMENPTLVITLEDDGDPHRVLSMGEIDLTNLTDDSLLPGREEP